MHDCRKPSEMQQVFDPHLALSQKLDPHLAPVSSIVMVLTLQRMILHTYLWDTWEVCMPKALRLHRRI